MLPPQDSSSVIQFMTRAKVKADPALRVVEIASGNPEEMMVSQPTPRDSPSRRGGNLGDLVLESEGKEGF